MAMAVAETSDGNGPPGRPVMPAEAYGAGIAVGGQCAVVGLLAIVGAFVASGGGEPGDYASGLVLSLAAIALAFLRLKHQLDGRPGDWAGFLFVDEIASLWIVVPLFAVLGLVGLFIAAGAEEGSLHDAGIGLFLASGFFVFLNLKHVFDIAESRR